MIKLGYLYGSIATLACLIHFGWCAGPSLTEWEKMLAEFEDSARRAPNPYAASSSHPQRLATDPYDTRTSWSDVLLMHATPADLAAVDHDANMQMDQDINSLRSQRANVPPQHSATLPATTPEQALLQRNGVIELTHDQRVSILKMARDAIYVATGRVELAGEEHDKVRPYMRALQKDGLQFYTPELLNLKPGQGVWPVTIAKQQLLLHQVTPKSPRYKYLHDWEQKKTLNRFHVAVWKHVGTLDPGIYTYVGSFPAPQNRLWYKYRDGELSKLVFRVNKAHILSGSTLHMQLEQVPKQGVAPAARSR